MDLYLGYDKNDLSEKDTSNTRNSYSSKTIKSELGPVKKIDIMKMKHMKIHKA